MTDEEAQAEAQKRWGSDAVATCMQSGPDAFRCRVGRPSQFPYGMGPTFEIAFTEADKRIPVYVLFKVVDLVEEAAIPGLQMPPTSGEVFPAAWQEPVPTPYDAHRICIRRNAWIEDLVWREPAIGQLRGSYRLLIGMVTATVGVFSDHYRREAEHAVLWAERLVEVAKLGERIQLLLAEYLQSKQGNPTK